MLLGLVILCGLLSIVYGVYTINSIMSADAGTARMQEISGAVAEGAQAYLKRQYTTIAGVGVVVFIGLGLLLSWIVALGFAIGAILSGAAGFIGMNVSVRANVRTAQAATKSLAGGLDIAFRSGAVTGLLVAGLALLGVAGYFGVPDPRARLRPVRPRRRSTRWSRSALARRSSRSSPDWAAASSPRAPTSAPISSARSRRAFPRTIRATRRRSPTTSATMSATAPAWRPTCSRPMR